MKIEEKIYRKLLEVPSGHVTTYGDLAKAINLKNGQRIVGQIMKKNPFPVIVPCHRVVKSDGTVGLNVWLYGGDLKDFYLLVDAAKKYVKDLGGDFIMTFDHRKGWNRLLKKLGFVEHGKTLIWRL